jgi:hypothetical protein
VAVTYALAGQASGVTSDAALGLVTRVLIGAGAALAVLALAILPLLAPPVQHMALDAAGSAALLGVEAETARMLSDRSVGGLLGAGGFAFAGPDGGPFYDAAEQRHLAEAAMLLWIVLLAGSAAAVTIAAAYVRSDRSGRGRVLGAVATGGAAVVLVTLVLGVLASVAFDPLFRLFHEVFFPQGGWAFDPTSQRLVQLYPVRFWQLMAAALGVSCLFIGTATWWLATRAARRAR